MGKIGDVGARGEIKLSTGKDRRVRQSEPTLTGYARTTGPIPWCYDERTGRERRTALLVKLARFESGEALTERLRTRLVAGRVGSLPTSVTLRPRACPRETARPARVAREYEEGGEVTSYGPHGALCTCGSNWTDETCPRHGTTTREQQEIDALRRENSALKARISEMERR